MTDTPPAPPGWYAAGVAGEDRWWDGVQWTPHTRPVGPVPSTAPPAYGGAGAQTQAGAPASGAPASGAPARQLWGTGSPEGSIAAGVIAAVLVLVALLVSIGFLAADRPVQGIAGIAMSIVGLALPIVAFINAAVGFRLRRERQAAEQAAGNNAGQSTPQSTPHN